MIICLKSISEECSLFIVNVSARLKLVWALGVLSDGTQALGNSEGIWALKEHLGTWSLGGNSKGT